MAAIPVLEAPVATLGQPTRRTGGATRSITAVVMFGLAFGYVEAAVVVYLRALYEPIHQRLHPGRHQGDLFPLIRIDQLDAEGPAARRWLDVELVRELATLVMLAAVGLAAGKTLRQSFAAFLLAFGVWDLAFYGWLRVLIAWPSSPWTWDLLFLLPLPWTAPVIAPMIVAVSMIGSSLVVIVSEAAERPFRITRTEWSMVYAGGAILVVAFCWDFRNVMAGGLPRPFHWPLFWLGQLVGLAGFASACSRHRRLRRHSVTIAIRPQ